MKKTTIEWIELANKKHNYQYDYSLIDEITSDRYQKVPIRCKKGHIFYMTMKDHIGSCNRKGNGCKECSKTCSNTESFIRLSNEIHGNKYDYSKSEYIGQKIKTTIICPMHGEFMQTPGNHYHLGRGCPRCRESRGEISIRKWLNDNRIKFIKEKTFNDCVSIKKLKFDFYLPDYQICIEYDGIQHFEPIQRFGGIKEFKERKLRDSIKTNFCSDHMINLIRISYLEKDKIEDILEENIEKIF